MRRWSISALVMFAALAGFEARSQQSPVMGRWVSESGAAAIEIYSCDDRLCGKLVWGKEPTRNGVPAMDDKNPDPALRTRPLCGLVMLGDFRTLGDNRWGDGWIYNPENGKTYRATITLKSTDVLHLRGYVGIPLLGETQTWTRANPALGSC
jgi:uncharacterized protein (DUF2147 family)